jgi:hypothetical protein
MNTMNRWRFVFGLAAVPMIGGCMATGYPTNTVGYSSYDSGYGVAQTSEVRIGVNVSVYPDLVPIPGYPVYYAPDVSSNYFFYDGVYWVFSNNSWYAGSWYNGPWVYVAPDAVPLYILRVPVRYYRHPPAYFRGWHRDASPHWGEHWGPQWERQRSGWDHWNRSAAPAPAPLPLYQRQYSGQRYPRLAQQPALRGEQYRYQPHDSVGRRLYQDQPREQFREQPRNQPRDQPRDQQRNQPMEQPMEQPAQRGYAPPAQQRPQNVPQDRNQRQMEFQHSNPPTHVQQERNPSAPRQMSPQRDGTGLERSNPPAREQRFGPQNQPRQQGPDGRERQPRDSRQGVEPQVRDAQQNGKRGQRNERDDPQRQDRNP